VNDNALGAHIKASAIVAENLKVMIMISFIQVAVYVL
jgi:hypothetical protein